MTNLGRGVPVKAFKYFEVFEIQRKKGRKTSDFEIVTLRGDVLGRLEFYPSWRQHVLVADECAVWSSGCLLDVVDCLRFIRDMSQKKETC